jgi:hypothetical protein
LDIAGPTPFRRLKIAEWLLGQGNERQGNREYL